MKLDDRHRRILGAIGTQRWSAEPIANALGAPIEEVEQRLCELSDNGLVSTFGNNRYEQTESGRRVLVVSTGVTDERIDTTGEFEKAIESFDLREDEVDAIRHVFTFLRYWGQVTEEEIIDAIYPEAPAGRGDPNVWWDALVHEVLVALPTVKFPTETGDPWRYVGIPEISGPFTDGRRVLSDTPVYGDIKHCLESLGFTEGEREAARAAFRFLYRYGPASERSIIATIYPEYPAGFDSVDTWWETLVVEAFSVLPRIDKTEEGLWEYRRFKLHSHNRI